MPRAEISDWEPQDFDDLKIVRHLYTQECLDAIIAHLGELSSADEKRKTQDKIVEIALALHVRLNQSNRPTIAEQFKAFESLFDGLDNTLSCLSAFDLRSKEKVEDIANDEPQQNHEDQYSGGRERVARSIRAMEDLWRWTTTALQIASVEIKKEPIRASRHFLLRKSQTAEDSRVALGKVTMIAGNPGLGKRLKKRGRPEERAALERLHEIWASSQARKTTRSFCEFAEAALGPALRENMRNEALGYLARSIIEERNANTGT